MKKAISISRIVTCVAMALYTLFTCFHAAQTAQYMCFRITPVGEEYVVGFDSITSEAWLFIISGVALLALGGVAIFFLFRRGLLAAVISTVAALTSAVHGMCLNTMLSEAVLWREIARIFKIYGTDVVYISIKNVLGVLSILAVVCYFVLYIISYKKLSNAGENANEQNS